MQYEVKTGYILAETSTHVPGLTQFLTGLSVDDEPRFIPGREGGLERVLVLTNERAAVNTRTAIDDYRRKKGLRLSSIDVLELRLTATRVSA